MTNADDAPRVDADQMPAVAKLAAGPGNLDLVPVPVPAPGPGEVLLEVLSAGVCGTDLHIEDGEFPSSPPVTLGHEVSGRVVALGAGVDERWVGRRVACETYYSYCGVCPYCRDGRINLCALRRSIGSHVNGGFAPRLALPVRNCHEVPPWISEHAGALAEPLACVCNCLLDPGMVLPGDEVLVTGPGTMGLLAAQVARAAGGHVTVVGTQTDTVRLAVADRLGFPASDDAGAVERRMTGLPLRGADVVVECSGHPGGAALCLSAVRPGGRYVQIGLFGSPVPVALDQVCYRELRVSSGFASTPRSWSRAMRLLRARTVELDPLVTEAAPLGDWRRVLDATRRSSGLKFVFDPRLGATGVTRPAPSASASGPPGGTSPP